MAERLPDSLLAQVDAAWALISRMIAFFAGLAILMLEQQSEGQRFYLIVAGIGLCGPVVAQSVATVFVSIRGKANGSEEQP